MALRWPLEGALLLPGLLLQRLSLSYQGETLANNKSFAAESSEMEIEYNESCAK
jgi:hypothetical protein